MTYPQQLAAGQANAEVIINRNAAALAALAFGSKNEATSSGLTWGYWGGRWGGTVVADGTLALTASAPNYIVANASTGAISVSTSSSAWSDTTTYRRIFKVTTGTAAVSSAEDHRAGPSGLFGGGGSSIAAPTGVSVSSVSSDTTMALTDAGTCIYHPPSDTTARTWTIPANASVAFPVGTIITLDNDIGAGAITVAITTDTLVLVGTAGGTGSRTIASGGQATLVKVSATRWRISGVGVS